MATTKHTGAKLRGFLYPIFPDGLGELRQIQKQFRPDYADLERIAKSLPEFTLVSRTITSDEYQWYCALFFTTELGRIAILFPWAYDSKMVDGDDTVWEKMPMERLAKQKQLSAFFHEGFWQPMDTLRDKVHLEELWDTNQAPWKLWKD